MTRTLAAACLALVLTGSAVTFSQEGAADLGSRLLQDPAIKLALESARRNEPSTIQEQIELCEVAAPPFKEDARAQLYKKKFEQLGLKDVRIDAEGNVVGDRPGQAERPRLLFTAHLDTVFPEGTDVRVKRDGPMLRGPGIGDNCRGLAVVLAVIRALNEAKVTTPGTVSFAGTVGEEGLGDLRGVKRLFNDTLKGQVDRFVAIDGAGLGITNVAVGSLRYRTTFKGPGGHSYGAFGNANPIHALGRAIARISELQVPAKPKTTFNVGRIGGGTSVNSIPFEGWLEMDMRSADPASLQAVDTQYRRAIDEALADENARWNQRGRLTVENTLVGNRPAGSTAEDSPLVCAAVSVDQALSIPPDLGEGSTDANVPMSMKIPAITIDGGGRGTGSHSLNEAFDTTDSWKGTQRAVLLAIAASQK
ncbi:MAG: M20/M25/M40 family metallo-hydrolase [Acidobacteria bacterium]|nr:M20/M25/M40 family metallo-hydrolase [Acidobacteriota bacterium]